MTLGVRRTEKQPMPPMVEHYWGMGCHMWLESFLSILQMSFPNRL